jgi:hypothetical protein
MEDEEGYIIIINNIVNYDLAVDSICRMQCRLVN